ncbi:hypothetical protein M9H77_03101 [Catharanthus roseus]|uniref:Uncharacterized protein n=1 Tax=Catharanthus roseus TaxID=4058 RepID=A0ACC0CAQ3_CATRO|nr:hypothetical protein M9H77_03101 [Catharanthus roseus]
MKSGLGYTGTNPNHTTDTHVTQCNSSYTTFGGLEVVFVKGSLSRAEKRNLIKKHKARKPPLVCDYCKMIGHICQYPLKKPCAPLSTIKREDQQTVPTNNTSNALLVFIRAWQCIFSSLPYQGAHGYPSLIREG